MCQEMDPAKNNYLTKSATPISPSRVHILSTCDTTNRCKDKYTQEKTVCIDVKSPWIRDMQRLRIIVFFEWRSLARADRPTRPTLSDTGREV